jgi:hypothetical protein
MLITITPSIRPENINIENKKNVKSFLCGKSLQVGTSGYGCVEA